MELNRCIYCMTARLVYIVITRRLMQYAAVGLFFISYFALMDYHKVSGTYERIGLSITTMLLLSF